MIKKYELNIVKEFEYPDHYNYSEGEINQICEEAKNLNFREVQLRNDLTGRDRVLMAKKPL